MNETALELVATPQVSPNLFGTNEPKEMIQEAAKTAGAIADVIKAKHLYRTIGGKNHVFIEGWTLLGAMRGVFASTMWTRPLEDGGWEARVEARTLAGQLVGAAEASCTPDEPNWRGKPTYALRSMAQTRAASKALRMPLGFILVLAGYEACPAEEMPSEDLTEPLKASIAAVQERKRRLEQAAEEGGGKVVTRATRPKIEMERPYPPMSTRLGAPKTGEIEIPQGHEKYVNFTAPPLCPECKSPVGRFVSESKEHKGRAYWECQRRNDKILELKEQGLTMKQIMPAAGVEGHWRSWAEPWPRKAGEPKDGQ